MAKQKVIVKLGERSLRVEKEDVEIVKAHARNLTLKASGEMVNETARKVKETWEKYGLAPHFKAYAPLTEEKKREIVLALENDSNISARALSNQFSISINTAWEYKWRFEGRKKTQTKELALEMFDDGKSIHEIAIKTGLSQEKAKEILLDEGRKVDEKKLGKFELFDLLKDI